ISRMHGSSSLSPKRTSGQFTMVAVGTGIIPSMLTKDFHPWLLLLRCLHEGGGALHDRHHHVEPAFVHRHQVVPLLGALQLEHEPVAGLVAAVARLLGQEDAHPEPTLADDLDGWRVVHLIPE